ncbi:MAG: adenylate/guanylate cyclase domain-containing protein [Dehalococcoidia bacterium]
MPDVTSINQSLVLAREAFARQAWPEASSQFAVADAAAAPLAPVDLEQFGFAAYMAAQLDAAIGAFERAHVTFLRDGDAAAAARPAMMLISVHAALGDPAIAGGWLRRATDLLEGFPACIEQGTLAHHLSRAALHAQELEPAMEHAMRAYEIGRQFGDLELRALGLDDQGLVAVAQRDIKRGLELMDQAITAALSAGLGLTTAIIYCNIISTCRDVADYGRAREWTDAARRWGERQAVPDFPGLCRVYRAELMRVRGAWMEAECDMALACEQLEDSSPSHAAEAYRELGEIRLRKGDRAGAALAFQRAHELGHEPQPGLALLRMEEGEVDAAAAMIQRTVALTRGALQRARLLPAYVEIIAAAGDMTSAAAGADELEEIAEVYGTPALRASAAATRGALMVTQQDYAAAATFLREAVGLWQDVEAPYEAARGRVMLAAAYDAQGDTSAAKLELQSAQALFERLGATPDAERAAAELARRGQQVTAAARASRTFMFTDICLSTNLIEALGDAAWDNLLRWHDGTMRALFAAHGGEEVKHQGDGFFVAFRTTRTAVDCAIAIQRGLDAHRRTTGFSPEVKVGLHVAEAIVRDDDYFGIGVNEAARIAAQARAGEIIVTQTTLDETPGVDAVDVRALTLKGIATPVQVASIVWR